MRQLKLLTAIALIGGTAAACSTHEHRVYDSAYPTHYVMAPAGTTIVTAPAPAMTTTQVVTSPWRPSYPGVVSKSEGHAPSAYYVTGSMYGF